MAGQINTLIWLNIKLKKRSSFLFLEFLIPLIIIVIIGYKSQWQEEEIKIPEIINSNITTVDNIENLPGYRLVERLFAYLFCIIYELTPLYFNLHYSRINSTLFQFTLLKNLCNFI
ncbi:hypothetical protein H8356DRAFT_1089338 [Neocallimastix lanati (nom. inval.)]|nr:hypothetical protein H8356DRAFT_1089338 [Neocallimastix sp. JGI-2020a]